MKLEDVKEFFNNLASSWDEHMVINKEVIDTILNNAKVSKNKKVLDVACGTGVMIPFYLERKVASIVGIDLSDKMCDIAKQKFTKNNIKIVCGDALTYDYQDCFDCIMVYNALPHFDDPQLLIHNLTKYLSKDGTLSISHSMSREKVLMHHKNAENVSKILPEIEELKKMMEKELVVEVSISNDQMYQVVGRKN